MSLLVNDRARSTCTFALAATPNTPADPTTVVVRYRAPAGTTTTKTYGTDAEVVKASTGVYRIDIDVTEAGTWQIEWRGTSAVPAVGHEVFQVGATF